MRLNNRLILAAAPALIGLFIRALGKSIRFSTSGYEKIRERWEQHLPSIYALWHQRLLMMPLTYDGHGLFVLISDSRDGELISRAVSHLGVKSVRGSATRGGTVGFRRLVGVLRNGGDVAITPDGPRGPKWQANMGAIALSKATGAPIFPVTYACSKCKRFNSWDEFIVPAPFTRGVFLSGDPIQVPEDAGQDKLEELRLELETRLVAITEHAEDLAGHPRT